MILLPEPVVVTEPVVVAAAVIDEYGVAPTAVVVFVILLRGDDGGTLVSDLAG